MDEEGDDDSQCVPEARVPQKTITSFFKPPAKNSSLTSIKPKTDVQLPVVKNSKNCFEVLGGNSITPPDNSKDADIDVNHVSKTQSQVVSNKINSTKNQASVMHLSSKSDAKTKDNQTVAWSKLSSPTDPEKKKRNCKRKASVKLLENENTESDSVNNAELKTNCNTSEMSYSDYLNSLTSEKQTGDEEITLNDAIEIIDHDNSMCNDKEDKGLNSSAICSDKQEKGLNSSTIETKEMSYSEYLNSLSSEEDCENEDVKDEEEKMDISLNNGEESTWAQSILKSEGASQQEVSKSLETDDEEISFKDDRKVSYPGIEDYFKKSSAVKSDVLVEINEINTDDDEEPCSETVTVSAEVHDVPMIMDRDENKTGVFQRSLSSWAGARLNIESRIELLSSEVVDNPEASTKLTEETNLVTVESQSDDSTNAEERPDNSCNSPPKTRGLKRARKSLNNSFVVNCDSENTGDDDICLIEDGNSDITEQREKQKQFLKSAPNAASSTKSMQATLCFTKTGLTMQKSSPVKASPVKTNRTTAKELQFDKPLDESTPLTKLKKRKKTSEECDESSIKKRGKKNKLKLESKKTKSKEISRCQSPKKTSKSVLMSPKKSEKVGKRSLRPRYKVTFIDVDENQKTPIRMKFRRCGKNSSGEESITEFTSKKKIQMVEVKPNVKVTKAQEILDRAKKSKPTRKKQGRTSKAKKRKADEKNVTKSDNDSLSDNSLCRRSSRLAGKKRESLEEVVIVDVENEDSLKTPNKKSVKSKSKKAKSKIPGKSTPGKQTPKKTQQGNMKIAPIFMNKKATASQENTKIIPIDPEKEKQRKAFLMSGIPQELKRQTAATVTLEMPEYLPVPIDSHIQQIANSGDNEINIWNMQPVDLKLTAAPCFRILEPKWRNLSFQMMNDIERKEGYFQSFQSHSDIDSDTQKKLLNEIGYHCPQFPIQQMFEAYQKKKFTVSTDVQSSSEKDCQDRKRSLSGDIIIIENEPTGNASKKKIRKRRSLRSRKSGENETDTCGEKENTENKSANVAEPDKRITDDLLWTERYQPSNSSEIIGNAKLVKKLKTWLFEWKQRIDKEEKKMRKLLMKQKKKCSNKTESSSEWWGEDSDFDLDSDDTDMDDDDRLCNTVLLQGPNGIGKTATVYALAQEYGYKVFEVNASSSRKGVKILSQLQEATQSHQVSTNKDELLSTFAAKTDQAKKKAEPSREKMPLSFAGFFKTSSNSAKPGNSQVINLEQKENKKKRKRKEETCDDKTPAKKKKKTEGKSNNGTQPIDSKTETTESGGVNPKGLELSSTSLILFDEVDVIFEEDKGFLAAVQSFMSTTKIPIILTTTDKSFAHRFDARYEQINFKPPSSIMTTCYLQMICLIENVRTCHREISKVVEFCNYDIRHCMLNLQLWVSSGGGSIKENKPLRITRNNKVTTHPQLICDEDSTSCKQFPENHVLSAISNNSQLKCYDSDSDFDIPRSRSRKLVMDDDSSNSCFNVELVKKNVVTENTKTITSVPSMHSSLLNSLLGSSRIIPEELSKLIKSVQAFDNDDFKRMIDTIKQYQLHGISLTASLFFKALPMTKVKLDPLVLKLNSCKNKPPVGRRKRIRQDMFDNENSSDSEENNENQINPPDECEKKKIDHCQSKQELKCILKSLNAFSDLYDSYSFVDIMNNRQLQNCTSKSNDKWSRVLLNNGLSDRFSELDSRNEFRHVIDYEITTDIQVRQSCSVLQDIDEVMEASKQLEAGHLDCKDKLSLPISGVNKNSQFFEDFMESSSSNEHIKRVNENVSNSLPDLHYNSHEQIVLDYIPTLRSITKTEHLRQTAKTKRRFFHYFDSISLSLKESTMEMMLSTFAGP